MGYLDKIDEAKQKIYNHSIATRILDLVDTLRLNTNDTNQRRWIWELIQNAKDVAYENQPISLFIDYDKVAQKLDFRHNGKPFLIEDITFLIEQVSTKERNNKTNARPISTGKFGTGFLTTHLLSEIVEVESVVKDDGLPYKKFKLILDRSGNEIDSIIKSVNNSLSVLNNLDEIEDYKHFDSLDFNTKFSYLLDDEGILTAEKGISDLANSIPYTIVFVDKIESVSVNNKFKYERQQQAILLDEIEIHTVQKRFQDRTEEIFIALVSNGLVDIAIEIVPVGNTYQILNPSKDLPKLFCDFPLIGTEDFNFPVVVNSSLFNPTEPRNGIYLTDVQNREQISENKELIIQACQLYLKLLKYASLNGWKDLWVLAQVSLPKNYEWVSKEWYSNRILKTTREYLLNIQLVDTHCYGRVAIECGHYPNFPVGATVDFPKGGSIEKSKKMWSLCNNAYYIIPSELDSLKWVDTIWDDKYVVTVKKLVALIEQKQTIHTLSSTLKLSIEETFDWLNNVYELIIADDLEKEVFQKNIFPDQNGVFRKREELFIEKEKIPSELKEILFDFGDDVRAKLMDISIVNYGQYNHLCTLDMVATEISKHLKIRFVEIVRSSETKNIFRKIYLWFGQDKKLAELIFENLYKNKHKLLDDEEIVGSLKKAELYEALLAVDGTLSVNRMNQLLELEALSKTLLIDKTYNPDEIQKRKNFENGWKGEAFVYKKLKEKGYDITWPNKSDKPTQNYIVDFLNESHYIEDQMYKYDIAISHPNKTTLFVQVKTTSTDISRSNEIAMPISVREWQFINEIENSNTYYLARVFNINGSPEVYFMKVDNINNL